MMSMLSNGNGMNGEPRTISQPALALAETYPWITDLCPLSVDRRPRLTGV